VYDPGEEFQLNPCNLPQTLLWKVGMSEHKDPKKGLPKVPPNLSAASLDQLALTSVIGEQRPRSLFNYRDSRGSIQRWVELDEVSGFTKVLIQKLKTEGFTI
jgi:DNA uptake protein ComE-like DNA-binding protein